MLLLVHRRLLTLRLSYREIITYNPSMTAYSIKPILSFRLSALISAWLRPHVSTWAITLCDTSVWKIPLARDISSSSLIRKFLCKSFRCCHIHHWIGCWRSSVIDRILQQIVQPVVQVVERIIEPRPVVSMVAWSLNFLSVHDSLSLDTLTTNMLRKS